MGQTTTKSIIQFYHKKYFTCTDFPVKKKVNIAGCISFTACVVGFQIFCCDIKTLVKTN